MEVKKHLLTKSEKEKLEIELKQLVNVDRPAVIESLKEARAQGDLSENAEYDNARNKQAEVEARIASIEAILANCEIIKKDASSKTVKLGSKVTIEEFTMDGQGKRNTETYEIVGALEADPFENKISNESPLGKAIMNQKLDATISITGIESSYRVKIKSIH